MKLILVIILFTTCLINLAQDITVFFLGNQLEGVYIPKKYGVIREDSVSNLYFKVNFTVKKNIDLKIISSFVYSEKDTINLFDTVTNVKSQNRKELMEMEFKLDKNDSNYSNFIQRNINPRIDITCLINGKLVKVTSKVYISSFYTLESTIMYNESIYNSYLIISDGICEQLILSGNDFLKEYEAINSGGCGFTEPCLFSLYKLNKGTYEVSTKYVVIDKLIIK